MRPLPMLDECVPNCGRCCGGVTPFTRDDASRAVEHLNGMKNPKLLERQIRYWGGSSRVCPFLQADAKCFIYEARPEVCKAFGHVPMMECPREAEGEARFSRWSLDEEIAMQRRIGNQGFTTAAWLGQAIKKAMSAAEAGMITVELISRDQFQEAVREGRRAYIEAKRQEGGA
jgi:Fe-S-cluster containining protein